MYTFFVLDFDLTYDNEDRDSNGVEPMVYLVKEEDVKKVHECAVRTHDEFHEIETDECMEDMFVRFLSEDGIKALPIGCIPLTFGERGEINYLAGNIHLEVI